jgi:hypothetical protein
MHIIINLKRIKLRPCSQAIVYSAKFEDTFKDAFDNE